MQADRPQLAELRRFREILKRSKTGGLVGLIQCGTQLVAPGVGVGGTGRVSQPAKALGVLGTDLAAPGRPVVEYSGQGHRHIRRAARIMAAAWVDGSFARSMPASRNALA